MIRDFQGIVHANKFVMCRFYNTNPYAYDYRMNELGLSNTQALLALGETCKKRSSKGGKVSDHLGNTFKTKMEMYKYWSKRTGISAFSYEQRAKKKFEYENIIDLLLTPIRSRRKVSFYINNPDESLFDHNYTETKDNKENELPLQELEVKQLINERDELREQVRRITSACSEFHEDYKKLEEENEKLKEELKTVRGSLYEISEKNIKLYADIDDHKSLEDEYKKLEDEYKKLEDNYDSLQYKYENVNNAFNKLSGTHTRLHHKHKRMISKIKEINTIIDVIISDDENKVKEYTNETI